MHRAAHRRAALKAERLEDRVNPVSFSSLDAYWVGSNVLSVAVGDVNGDGKPDIVAGTGDSSRINVLINDGTGEFASGANVPISAPFHVKLADLNNDGKLDILVGNSYGQQVVFALGNGDGTFQDPIAHNIGTTVQDIAAADFNGDGRLDAVVSIPGGSAILLNDGSAHIFHAPAFHAPTPASDSLGITTGDFNGDGKPDYAVAGYSSNRVDVYLNPGNGAFGNPVQYTNANPDHSTSVLARDFNNDGKLDLMVGYAYSGDLGLMVGNGDGTFQAAELITTSLSQNGPVAAADFNLDGNLDLVVMQAGVGDEVVLMGDGMGHFMSGTRVFQAWPGDVQPADLNGDGLPDIVTGHALSPGLVSISLNTTAGVAHTVTSFGVSAPASAIAGESFTITVTARDSNTTTITDYTGTVHFTSSDGQAILPEDVQFTSADNGVKTFTVTLGTAGSQSIIVTDMDHLAASGSAHVTVTPAVATSFEVDAPSSAIAGTAFGVTITARDEFGNIATGYTGPVHFTSTDPAAQLPADAILTGGVGTVSVTLMTAGDWIITAADTAASLSAESGPITVSAVLATPPIVADFGNRGLHRWTAAGGWVIISPLNAEYVVASGDGTTVVADFGNRGLQRWTEAGGWTILTPANVEKAAVSFDGRTVLADFGVGGLKRWTETGGWVKLTSVNVQDCFLSSDGEAVIADFGRCGLRRWTATGGWFMATNANPLHIAVDADCNTVVADFPWIGLVRWNATDNTWLRLSAMNVQHLAISADGGTIVADFNHRGLQLWTETGGWVKLSPMNAEHVSISADGQSVVADFGSRGLRRWTPTGWVTLSTANVQDAIIAADGGTVVADFGVNGLQVYETAWTILSGLDPEEMLVS